jgi:hypothetical protein
MRKTIVSVLVLAAALFTVGSAAAATNCGPGGGGDRAGGVSTSKLVTAAASQLGVSRATLVSAIQSSANATIDAAVTSGDLTAAQAADAKQDVADNLDKAYRLSTTSGVATKLGVTTTALDSGFNAARKSLLNAQIDAALAAGKITSDQATAQKAKVAALTTGYKPSGDAAGLALRGRHR